VSEARDQRPGELLLAGHDLASVLLEGYGRGRYPQGFALAQKLSEEILESFYGERMPARGGCGRRG
jgi:hypothetical protein